MKGVRIRVSGKVQGVFFRASAKDTAEGLGLSGMARNERDGSVYVEAEGEEGALERFADWCRQGPPRATVMTYVREEMEPKGYVGFKIKRP